MLGIFFISSVAQVSAQEIKKIGKYKDWEAIIVSDAEGKVCFAQSLPILQAPKKIKEMQNYLWLSDQMTISKMR